MIQNFRDLLTSNCYSPSREKARKRSERCHFILDLPLRYLILQIIVAQMDRLEGVREQLQGLRERRANVVK